MSTFVRAERQPGRDGDITVGREGVTGTASETWRVIMSDKLATPSDVVTLATTLPAYGTALGHHVLTSKKPKQVEGAETMWDVVCEYTLPQPGQEARSNSTVQGEIWAIEISAQSSSYTVGIEKDIDGITILNSAGDPVLGITTLMSDMILSIGFSCDIINWDGIAANMNGINSIAFTLTINGATVNFPTKTVLFESFDLGFTSGPDGNTHPKIKYQLAYRPGTWLFPVANKGYNYKPSGTGAATPILEADGTKTTNPRYLAANGDTLTLTGGTATATYFNVRRYNEVNLGAFLAGLET